MKGPSICYESQQSSMYIFRQLVQHIIKDLYSWIQVLIINWSWNVLSGVSSFYARKSHNFVLFITLLHFPVTKDFTGQFKQEFKAEHFVKNFMFMFWV